MERMPPLTELDCTVKVWPLFAPLPSIQQLFLSFPPPLCWTSAAAMDRPGQGKRCPPDSAVEPKSSGTLLCGSCAPASLLRGFRARVRETVAPLSSAYSGAAVQQHCRWTRVASSSSPPLPPLPFVLLILWLRVSLQPAQAVHCVPFSSVTFPLRTPAPRSVARGLFLLSLQT
jgi:hypothetical protein